MKVCRSLSLATEVKVVYEYIENVGQGICDRTIPSDQFISPEYWDNKLRRLGGKVLKYDNNDCNLPEMSVNWVTPFATGNNQIRSTWATYGNEPGIDYSYGIFCFIVKIARSSKRVGST